MVFKVRNIDKRYGATHALKSVDFDIYPGAVNVLIGENGAGKSTLMKIITGIEQADNGELLMHDEVVYFSSIAEAYKAGVSIVHQELNLCQNMSVAENIFLGRNISHGGMIDEQAECQRSQELLTQFKQSFSPNTPVSQLRVGQQQIVEIAKALLFDAKVLILDEPTSALSPNEVELLFSIIRDLKAKGVAIVYISHRLEELLSIGDYITVLRDGSLQASSPANSVDIDWIIKHMLGEQKSFARQASANQPGEHCLAIRGLGLARKSGGHLIKPLDTDINRREIVAIYGLLGSGRTELLECLAGLRPDHSGQILLNGDNIAHLSVSQRTKRGVFMVSEDRKLEGIFPNLTVGDNLGISFLRNFTKSGLIDKDNEKASLLDIAKRMWVKSDGLDASINSLSGGNQQKVMIGRCMLPSPKVLLIDEPSRGVDIGARSEIFDRIRSLAEGGTAVIYATSDLHEALQYSDRIIVLAHGQISGEFNTNAATESDLIYACNKPSKAS